MKDALTKIPVIKILLPFIIGIFLASSFEINTRYAVITSAIFCILFLITTIIKSPTIRLSKSYYTNAPIIIICICLGSICYNLNNPKPLPEINYIHSNAKAIIKKIHDKDFSANMLIDVKQITDSCGNTYHLNQTMTAWIEANDYSLKEGSIISFKFNPQEITNNGNPEEFDYKKYMQYKGVLYHVFIKQNEYRIIGQQNDIHTFFRSIQRNLINLLLDSQLTPNTKTFFITIILGDSSYLDKELRESMSHAGIAHILALSGLHMGIIALLISILFIPLDYLRMKRARLLVTLIITILFAFLTGLSHSIVRATIMIGFVIMSKILYRKNTSINSLLFAALVILIIAPTAIYDIGFQFSFVSVLLILLLESRINTVSPKNELLYYFISLFSISLITTIGTSVLTAYYYNYISPIALFSNIIVIPILPLIVGCGIIYLILLSIGYDCNILAKLSDSFYLFITNFASDTNEYQNSYIDNIYLSPVSLCLYISAIIFFIIFIYRHKAFFIYSSLCFIIGGLSVRLIEKSQLPTYGYVIFNDYESTPILYFYNDSAQIIVPDDSFDINRFRSKHRKFIAKHHLNHIKIQSYSNKQHFFIGDVKITIINDSSIKRLTTTPKIETDIVLITKGFYGKIEDIIRNYNTKLIVLSGNIYYKKQNELSLECKKMGIKCHQISNHGAIYKYFNTK